MAIPYNEGHTHEALHTTYVLLDAFTRHVLESRCAEEFEDVANACLAIEQAMAELYQLIGS